MKSQNYYQKDMLQGNQIPTVRITPKYTATDGKDACKILQIGGLLLDPWQADSLDDWMALNEHNTWLNRTCGMSVARQNGKSGLAEGRIEAGMIMRKERVIYTAHLQKTATETFEEIASFFDSRKELRRRIKEIKTALGREQILLKSGARVKFLARTRNGGRGQHGDLLVFDEAQELDTSAQASFLPAISASLNPQTIYLGTPPDTDAEGLVFRSIRDKALDKNTKSTSWVEFSVDEIGDVTDRNRWVATNPALGQRIMETTIEGECEQMDADAFARERLGWWIPKVEHVADTVIDEKAWQMCKSHEPKPEGKTAYGVKFTADGAIVTLCGAVIPENGHARISLIDARPTGQGLQWLADWLNARYDQAACVVIDGRNGVDVLIDKIKDTWQMKNSIIRPGVKDVIAAVSTITDAINGHELTWFEGQEILDNSALTSTRRKIGGGWGFGGENSSPIEACALALWGAKTSKRNPNKEMRIG